MTICWLMIALVFPGVDVDALTAELHVETGMAYITQGLPDKAMEEFMSALEVSEDAFEAHLGLARVAVINNSWATAEEEYTNYIDLRPGDYRAPLELSQMLLQLRGRSIEALDYAEAALALAPLNSECWLVLAGAHGKLGNLEEAISLYTRIIVEDAELANEARVLMGSLLFHNGDSSAAREILLPAASEGTAEAHHILALIYMEQYDNLRATDSINRYLYLEPNGAWADSARSCLEDFSSSNLLNN